eukprot:209292-Pelagomonas_calceolata.AAC.2
MILDLCTWWARPLPCLPKKVNTDGQCAHAPMAVVACWLLCIPVNKEKHIEGATIFASSAVLMHAESTLDSITLIFNNAEEHS